MKKIIYDLVSEKGLYILLAVIGFLSGLTTMFVDLTSQISIKWFLAFLSVSLFVLIVFFSILNKIIWEKQIINTIKIVKVFKENNRIILKSNQSISMNSLLTIYVDNEQHEDLQCLCYVENIQENGLISTLIVQSFVSELNENLVKKGIVKTTIPLSLLGERNV
ncbi:hypothetical protein [Aliarcobacter butzleri]|uniref:hypothetical protein n=1 Tax=Aliarcobacter butzleri TaxID=28197 RepID=UPI00191B1C03|nr:hypothetical protein [Aliarcobacter butzleri]